jgi:EmrB/QacA subfamily drug resistance transporter
MLLGALDATIVGPAMPNIVRELGGMAMLSWVFTIYSLTSTITIPIVGKLSDLYGRKWFYLGGIAIFLIGSAASGAAGEAWLGHLTGLDPMMQLIVFRGIQGIGGGAMMANAMAIIGDLFAPRERGRYQGLTGGVFGLASVFGPMLGGWLTDALSWRWIFYINVPFGLVALAVLMATMPKPETGQQHKVDWWGATALTAGLVPLLLALNWGGSEYAWSSPTIIGLLATAAVALGLFCWRELRASEPILDIRLFRDRGFSASMVVLAGVVSDGLSTTVLPAASAGAIFQIAIISG